MTLVRFKDLPLRRKLALLLWVTIVVTLALSALVSLIAQSVLARRQVLENLDAQSQIIAENVAPAVDFADEPMARDTLSALVLNPDIRSACVYRQDGTRFAVFERGATCPPSPEPDDRSVGTPTARVSRPLQQGSRALGLVTITSAFDAVYRQVAIQGGVLLALFVGMVALGFVLSTWLQSLVSSRILQLADAAGRVTASRDYRVTLPVESRDEIGQLTAAFNAMLQEIAQQDAALRSANADLERRVTDRTRELADELGERRKAEMLLAQGNADLVRANQDLEDFAYITSHDLKEPLRGIRHSASFLLEDHGATLDESGRAKVETVGRLAARLEQLIESLLHYSRVGQVQLSRDPVDLNAVIDEVRDSIALTLEQAHADVHVARLPRVRCDAERVAEVFANLLINALKYNDKPFKRVKVGWTRRPGRGLAFFVRDNGIGISPKHLDTVFKIFKRLHPREAYGGGVGAGLTIVRKIVERHGGEIWIESEPSSGTTVFFTLGAAADAESATTDPGR